MQFKFKFVSICTALMMVFLVSCNKDSAIQPDENTLVSSQLAVTQQNAIVANTAAVKAVKPQPNAIALTDLIKNSVLSVDAKNKKLTFNVDGSKLDKKAIERLKAQKTYSVAAPFEISKSVTDPAFKRAGLETTHPPVTIDSGNYETQLAAKALIIAAGGCVRHFDHWDCWIVVIVIIY